MIYPPYRWHASTPPPQGGLAIEMHYNATEPKVGPQRPRGRPRGSGKNQQRHAAKAGK